MRLAAPCLSQNYDRDDRADSASEALLVQHPQVAVTSFGSEHCAGVIEDSRHLAGGPLWRDNPGVDEHLTCLGPLRIGQGAVVSLELRYRG